MYEFFPVTVIFDCLECTRRNSFLEEEKEEKCSPSVDLVFWYAPSLPR